jgi:hypothetical protein
VYGNDVRDRTPTGVVFAKYSAACPAISHSNDQFWIWDSIESALQGLFHIDGYGTCYQQKVSMPRARHEFYSYAFEVVVRVVESLNLELATIAGTSVDMANAESTAQDVPQVLLQSFDF